MKQYEPNEITKLIIAALACKCDYYEYTIGSWDENSLKYKELLKHIKNNNLDVTLKSRDE